MRKNKSLLLILLLFVSLRAYRINNPLTDYIAMRQVPVADIASNLAERNSSVFYPQYSTSGGENGYIEIEFQILPYITSFFYRLFGRHDMIGRLIAVIFSVSGFIFLYMLVAELGFPPDERDLIMMVYTVLPQNIYLSRCFMPEPVMLALITGFIYFLVKYDNDKKRCYLPFIALTGALAVLAKAPAAYALIVFFPLVLLNNKAFKYRFLLVFLLLLIILLPPFFYYLHSYRLGRIYESVGIWETGHGHISKWADIDTLTGPLFWKVLISRLFNYTITPVLFPFFIIGLALTAMKKHYVLLFWMAGVLSSFFILAKGTIANPYYLYPLTPLIAVMAGKGLHKFGRVIKKANLSYIMIAICLIYGLAYIKDYYIYEKVTYNMGRKVSELSFKDDKVLTVLHSSLYYSGRKGYLEKTLDPQRLDYYKNLGVRWFAYPMTLNEKYDSNIRKRLSHISRLYDTAYIDEDFIIFDLYGNTRKAKKTHVPFTGIRGLYGTKQDSINMRLECISSHDAPVRVIIKREGTVRGHIMVPSGKSRYNIRMRAYPHLHYIEIIAQGPGIEMDLKTGRR